MYFSPAQVQVEEHFLCQMRGALSFGSAALDTETAQIHSIGGLTTTRTKPSSVAQSACGHHNKPG